MPDYLESLMSRFEESILPDLKHRAQKLRSRSSDSHSQAWATVLICPKGEPQLAADLHNLTGNYCEQRLKSDINKRKKQITASAEGETRWHSRIIRWESLANATGVLAG